ncbi:MAG: hypothetical protein ACK4M1_01300 [Flavobacterium sp.]
MRKYIILFAITFGFISNNLAQTNHFESETIFLHTNETTFVTGETLLYKIYCLNANTNELSKISKIAYVEIIDNYGTSISRNKITLNNSTGTNEIFINTSFNTGNYKLIAYTNWMLNNSKSKYFETTISIINPFIPNKNQQYTESKTITSESFKDNTYSKNEDVVMNLSKYTYSKREKVELNIVPNSQKFIDGNYSVSVRKIDDLTFNKTTNSIDFINSNPDKFINSNTINYLPELRGELLSGKITTNDANKTINDKHIALSIIGEPFDFKIVKTNDKGEFHFILDKNLKKSEVILQIIENDLNDFQIKLNDKPKLEFNDGSSKNYPIIQEKHIKDIEARLVACQIVNAYSVKDSLKTNFSNFTPFYNYNAKEYILDDYKRFPTFKETIIEIVPAVYFKEKEGNYTLHIRDYVTAGESFGNALVLVDGLLLQDVNELFNYNTSNIYKISVVNKAYSYGSKIFSGVISITTFNREYTPKSKNILPIQIERCTTDITFQSLNYDSEKDFTRLPDYRYQLAWDTNVTLSKDANPFRFYTSDITGKFEIRFEGFSSKGEPISIKEYFEVN